MKMYLTMCGNQYRISRKGNINTNWPSMVFCTVDNFFEKDVYVKANSITSEQAKEALTTQILKINPSASEKQINKFIFGL